MNKTKQRFELDKEGNMLAIVTYPEQPVMVKVGDNEENIGVQPEYEVTQVINKEQAKILKEYLEEQYKLMEVDFKKAHEVIAKNIAYDNEKLYSKVKELVDMSSGAKKAKIPSIEKAFTKYNSVVQAKSHITLMQDGIDRIKEQLEFLKNYCK